VQAALEGAWFVMVKACKEGAHQWMEVLCPHCGGTGFIQYESSGTLSYGDSGYGHPPEEPCPYHQDTRVCCAICGKQKGLDETA